MHTIKKSRVRFLFPRPEPRGFPGDQVAPPAFMAPNVPDPPIPEVRPRHAPHPTSTSFAASLRTASISELPCPERTATVSASTGVPSIRTLRRRESRQRGEQLRQAAARRSADNAVVQQANIPPHIAGTETGSSSDASASRSRIVRGNQGMPQIVDANCAASPPPTFLLIQSIWRSNATDNSQRGTVTRTEWAGRDIERQDGQPVNALPRAGHSASQSAQSVAPFSHMPSQNTLQAMPGTYSPCVPIEIRNENNTQRDSVGPWVPGDTESAERNCSEWQVTEKAPAAHLVATQTEDPLVVQKPQPILTPAYSIFPPDEEQELADPVYRSQSGPSSRTRRRRESRLRATQLRKAGAEGSSTTDLLLFQEDTIPGTRARDSTQMDYGAGESAWNGANGTIAKGLEQSTVRDDPSVT